MVAGSKSRSGYRIKMQKTKVYLSLSNRGRRIEGAEAKGCKWYFHLSTLDRRSFWKGQTDVCGPRSQSSQCGGNEILFDIVHKVFVAKQSMVADHPSSIPT